MGSTVEIPDAATRIVFDPIFRPSGRLIGGDIWDDAAAAREKMQRFRRPVQVVLDCGPRPLHATRDFSWWDDDLLLATTFPHWGMNFAEPPAVLAPAGVRAANLICASRPRLDDGAQAWGHLLAATGHDERPAGRGSHWDRHEVVEYTLVRHHFTAGHGKRDLGCIREVWAKWSYGEEPLAYLGALDPVGGTTRMIFS